MYGSSAHVAITGMRRAGPVAPGPDLALAPISDHSSLSQHSSIEIRVAGAGTEGGAGSPRLSRRTSQTVVAGASPRAPHQPSA